MVIPRSVRLFVAGAQGHSRRSFGALLLLGTLAACASQEESTDSSRWTPLELALWDDSGLQMVGTDASVYGLRLSANGSNKDVYGVDLGWANHAEGSAGPLQVGIVNKAKGTFGGIQAGVTCVAQTLYGIQVGAIGIADVYGIQVAFGNAFSATSVSGVQLGFLNTVSDAHGIQLSGWANAAEGRMNGIQAAPLMNVATTLGGVQTSISNEARSGTGVQVGLANQASTLSGMQVGIFNSSSEGMRGMQLGLLNYNKNGFLPWFPLFNIGFGKVTKEDDEE